LTTTAGDLNLKIPKLRNGSFFPALLELRLRVDQARPFEERRIQRRSR
jgi:transposase-like protein